MPSCKRKQHTSAAHEHLVQTSGEYAASSSKRRTQQHVLIERFVAALASMQQDLGQQPSADIRSRLTRELLEGAHGHPKLLRAAFDRFGECGLHPDVMKVLCEVTQIFSVVQNKATRVDKPRKIANDEEAVSAPVSLPPLSPTSVPAPVSVPPLAPVNVSVPPASSTRSLKTSRNDSARLLARRRVRAPQRRRALRQQSLSPWRAMLCDEVRREAESSTRTAYPQALARSLVTHLRRLLQLFDRHVAATRFGTLENFFATASVDELREALRFAAKQCIARNERVRNTREIHHARTFVQASLRVVWCLEKHWGCAPDLNQLTATNVLCGIPNLRIPADLSVRRTYTAEEMTRMQAVTQDPAEDVILALLTDVGLRSGAIANMRYNILLTHNHVPRDVCEVMEKGRQMRTFQPTERVKTKAKILSDHLRSCHMDANLSECFLLNLRNIREPLKPHIIRSIVCKIAQRAQVTEVEVRPHSFRHTLVTKMVREGHPLTMVSQWIGHADVNTTASFYWLPTAEDLQRQLILPSPEHENQERKAQEHKKASKDRERKKLEEELAACRAAIAAYQRHATPETDKKVRMDLPVLDMLLNAIDESQSIEHITSLLSACKP